MLLNPAFQSAHYCSRLPIGMFVQNYKARFALNVGRYIQILGIGKSDGIPFPMAKLLSTFNFLGPFSYQRNPAIFAGSYFPSPTITAATFLVVQESVKTFIAQPVDIPVNGFMTNVVWFALSLHPPGNLLRAQASL
jgi:hypothetical protein|tara:strand:- start:11144 stop:11551 length:408 start_codon:yes stop_codon:yes gene_type:complete